MKQGIVDLKRKGIKALWSPAACDAELHKRLDVAKALDIGYVGNDGGIPRKFYLQEIRERYPSSFLGIAEYTKMSEIYSKSRIGFNYIRPKESITMRCMEIASCGALVLVNKISDGSAEELGFKDRESLVYYNSPKELFNLIDYYLAHDDKREAIAGRGHELVVSNHTYRHRLEEMLKIIGTSLGPRQNHSGATVDSGGKI